MGYVDRNKFTCATYNAHSFTTVFTVLKFLTDKAFKSLLKDSI